MFHVQSISQQQQQHQQQQRQQQQKQQQQQQQQQDPRLKANIHSFVSHFLSIISR